MSTPVPPRGSKCVTYIAQNGLTLRSSSLYDEARDWIVWTGGFSIAQEEVEVRYDMVRGCERWARGESSSKPPRVFA